MTPFFRRIRHKLANENQFLKYSRYAIGEILLVVVGILIALQINNWNSNRLNKLKEDKFLINLQRDLNKQLQTINGNIKKEKHIYNSLDSANFNYNKHKKFRAVKEDLVLLSTMNDRYTCIITNPTYTELLSTGNLDLISDMVFKDQLVRYYADLELTTQVIQKNNDYKDNVISSISISIFEIIGGSDPDQIYDGMDSSFKNYESPEHLLEIVKSNISKPENELILLNLLRFRRMSAFLHIRKFEKAKVQTEELLETMNPFMK